MSIKAIEKTLEIKLYLVHLFLCKEGGGTFHLLSRSSSLALWASVADARLSLNTQKNVCLTI